MKKNIFMLAVAIAVSLSAGAVGSAFTAPAIPGWYALLVKPALNPPSWVFGPVWTILYILMGVSAFLIWSSYAKATDGQAQKRIKIALEIFGLQLLVNAAWSVVFFGMQSPGLALVNIAALLFIIVATAALFYKISRPAAYLLIPYILWVGFASYLNYAIWVLN